MLAAAGHGIACTHSAHETHVMTYTFAFEPKLQTRTVRPGGAVNPAPCALADEHDPGRSGSRPRAAAGRCLAGGTGTPEHAAAAVRLLSARQACELIGAVEPRESRSKRAGPSRGCGAAWMSSQQVSPED